MKERELKNMQDNSNFNLRVLASAVLALQENIQKLADQINQLSEATDFPDESTIVDRCRI